MEQGDRQALQVRDLPLFGYGLQTAGQEDVTLPVLLLPGHHGPRVDRQAAQDAPSQVYTDTEDHEDGLTKCGDRGVEETPVIDPLEVELVDGDDLVEVRGSVEVVPQLQLGAVNHSGHEVAMEAGAEEDEPGPQ